MLCSKYHPPMPLVLKQLPLAGAMIVVDPAPMMLEFPGTAEVLERDRSSESAGSTLTVTL